MSLIWGIAQSASGVGLLLSGLLSIMTMSTDGFVGSFVSIAIGSGLVGSGIALLFAGLLTISKGLSNT